MACDDVLRQGVFDRLETNESSYSSMLWAWKLSQMTASEARSKVAESVTVPIEGMPVGGAFSDEQFNSWKASVQASMNFASFAANKRSVSQLAASATLLANWNTCIANKEGIVSKLSAKDANILFFEVFFRPRPSVFKAKIITPINVVGGRIISAQEAAQFQIGKEIQVQGIACQIQRDRPDANVSITLNTDQDVVTEFAPGIVTPPRFPDRPTIEILGRTVKLSAGFSLNVKAGEPSYGADVVVGVGIPGREVADFLVETSGGNFWIDVEYISPNSRFSLLRIDNQDTVTISYPPTTGFPAHNFTWSGRHQVSLRPGSTKFTFMSDTSLPVIRKFRLSPR